jgi:hypothetical protein
VTTLPLSWNDDSLLGVWCGGVGWHARRSRQEIQNMRINIYGEELREINDQHGPRVTLIHKQVVPDFKHSAIEILVGDRVVHTEDKGKNDDDTPTVKFWFADEYQRKLLVQIFQKALEELEKADANK